MDKERAKGITQLVLSLLAIVIGMVVTFYVGIAQNVPEIGNGNFQLIIEIFCSYSLFWGAGLLTGGIFSCILLYDEVQNKRMRINKRIQRKREEAKKNMKKGESY